MNQYDKVLAALRKEAFVPGDQMGQGGMPPVDPATGMPMDPAMMEQTMAAGGGGGMPPGMPPGMDPAMMDPAMMGAPPMDPAMMDPAMGGMPPGMDPSMMGAPPMDPAMMAPPAAPAAPAAPAEAPAGTGAPATQDDLAIFEERLAGMESLIEDLVDTIESLGGNLSTQAKEQAAAAAAPEEAAPVAGPAAVPGPFGSNANAAMGMLRPDGGGEGVMNNLIGRLSELRGG